MFVEQTCGTLACDGCAKTFGDPDEGGSWHFDDQAAALKTAADCEWEVTVDRVLCPECVDKRTCDAEGHEWSPWMGCMCGGEIEAHRGPMTTRSRYCGRDHCHANEREEIVGECEQRFEPTKLSDGARLIEHRRNWYLITAANPEREHEPHEVPAAVEDLVEQGAQIAARIDAALPEGFYVR